jgi:hypothetical protein
MLGVKIPEAVIKQRTNAEMVALTQRLVLEFGERLRQERAGQQFPGHLRGVDAQQNPA